MAQALVPLKNLIHAKSRLAGVLGNSERYALALAMVEDVLGVLDEHQDITAITLLSDDPGASLLAQKYSAAYWPESSLGCRGLNPLIECASERLLASGPEPLVVLHGDLPLLTVDDISAVLACQAKLDGLIVGCDSQGKGTNLLAFDAASAPRFCFGTDSCTAHVASASNAGVAVKVLRRVGIGVDVDEAVDLAYIMRQLHLNAESNTAQLLHNTELGARVSLALEAMLAVNEAGDSDFFNDMNTGMAN